MLIEQRTLTEHYHEQNKGMKPEDEQRRVDHSQILKDEIWIECVHHASQRTNPFTAWQKLFGDVVKHNYRCGIQQGVK